jgi:molybdopterin/thiamine biosynthesis adenylyltransferase
MPRMARPQVKPEHLPSRIAGGRIRIGGASYGIAAEIDDPSGSVWTLLESMDGTRSAEEVVARVRRSHPQEPEADVHDAIEALAQAGHLEDADAPDPQDLTDRDRERHDRGRRYFRWVDPTPRSSWEPQAMLRRARVTVAGVGGTGGVAAMALAASGVGRLHCVDGDVVELSNLNRQVLYTEDDIGIAKVDAAVQRLRRLNRDIEVTGDQRMLSGVDDLVELTQDCDLLLLAADRPMDLRTWANRACLATETPWITAGYHGPLVTVGAYVPGEGACYECLQTTQDEEGRAVGFRQGDAAQRGAAVAHAVTAPPAGLSGHLAAHAVVALLTGAPTLTPGTIHGVNLVALDAPFRRADPRRLDCPACADAA